MKRAKTVTVTVCDGCGADCDNPTPCLRCDKNFCYGCRSTKASEYRRSVHCSGTGDGLYCYPCETALMKVPTPVFVAYLTIKRLQAESEYFYRDFETRAKEAEAILKRLQK